MTKSSSLTALAKISEAFFFEESKDFNEKNAGTFSIYKSTGKTPSKFPHISPQVDLIEDRTTSGGFKSRDISSSPIKETEEEIKEEGEKWPENLYGIAERMVKSGIESLPVEEEHQQKKSMKNCPLIAEESIGIKSEYGERISEENFEKILKESNNKEKLAKKLFRQSRKECKEFENFRKRKNEEKVNEEEEAKGFGERILWEDKEKRKKLYNKKIGLVVDEVDRIWVEKKTEGRVKAILEENDEEEEERKGKLGEMVEWRMKEERDFLRNIMK